jgi:phosphatidylserine decarboxylase
MMAFATVDQATRIWIKGREFSVARLLGDRYKTEAKRYEGGALCIFRLAPQGACSSRRRVRRRWC